MKMTLAPIKKRYVTQAAYWRLSKTIANHVTSQKLKTAINPETKEKVFIWADCSDPRLMLKAAFLSKVKKVCVLLESGEDTSTDGSKGYWSENELAR